MAVYYVFGAIVVLLVAYFAALEFQAIAEMKGHYEKKYFWWSFLVGVIGMLMVVALPDRRKEAADGASFADRSQSEKTGLSDDLPDL